MVCMVWLFQMPALGYGMHGVAVSDAFAGSHPDMTFEVDWALKNNYLSVYLAFGGLGCSRCLCQAWLFQMPLPGLVVPDAFGGLCCFRCLCWAVLFQLPLLGFVVLDVFGGLGFRCLCCSRCLCWALLFQMPLPGLVSDAFVVPDAFAGLCCFRCLWWAWLFQMPLVGFVVSDAFAGLGCFRCLWWAWLFQMPLPGYGMGRVGQLRSPMTVEAAVAAVKSHLGLPHVRLARAAGRCFLSSQPLIPQTSDLTQTALRPQT